MDPGLVATAVEFDVRGRPGRVLVRYGVNADPVRWGYPLLGLPTLVAASRGFPVLQADVRYDAEGYAAIFAWIQIVREADIEGRELSAIVDRAPQLAALDLPYMSFGVCPSLFDAPSTDGADDIDWEAHAYLVVSPDALMTRRVQPVCGFRWGYTLRDGSPRVTALGVLEVSAWRADQAFLRDHHRSWDFGDWGSEPSTTQIQI